MPDPVTEFKLQRIATEAGPLALVTIDNGADHTKPTVFGRAALESLARVLDELESSDWVALVLTGKPFIFAAGADLDEFPRLRTREEAIAGSRAGHELFGRLRALPFPTVAAINGACLGGGVEIALHCHARAISPAVRHFALPECFLGIIPAWGGTQLVPHLVGAEAAVRFVVENPMRQNRMLDGRKAHELGLADRVIEPAEFVDGSIAYALELAAAGGVEREQPDLADAADVVRRARSRLDDSVHGAAPAPYRALELIELAATASLEEGYRAEEEAFADLVFSPETKASLYAFDVVERRKPAPPEGEARPVRKVGILGAGLMASQLAALFVRRLEVPLVMRDLDEAIVERALASVRGELAEAVGRGRLTEEKARFLGSIVTGSTGYDGFEDCDFVLEAVFESMDVKKQVFAEAEAVVRPDCVLATNTSALSVSEMAADLEHPERVGGMHFFNPVALMPLVEVVRAERSDEETLATTWATAEKLRKRPLLVADAPGFVVNRVLTRMTSTLMQAIEAGNTVEETDEAILRLGFPMAPSVLLQVVGPRVAYHVLETMHEAYPDRFPLSPALRAYADGGEPEPSGDERRSVEEITDAVLDAMADEVQHLLDEGIVSEPEDVDRALILGAGFPFWLAGRITKQTAIPA